MNRKQIIRFTVLVFLVAVCAAAGVLVIRWVQDEPIVQDQPSLIVVEPTTIDTLDVLSSGDLVDTEQERQEVINTLEAIVVPQEVGTTGPAEVVGESGIPHVVGEVYIPTKEQEVTSSILDALGGI